MPRTLIVHAHPRPARSVATRGLLQALTDLPDVAVHSLYDRYPDFDIDVAAEQQALREADLIVWLCPVYWYSVPGLLKHWFDTVLTHGWAYGHAHTGHEPGPATRALAGKTAWWVASAGGTPAMYGPGGEHGRPLADYIPAIEQTARFCGMHWAPPFVLHGGHRLPHEARAQAASDLRQQADALLASLERAA
ncbi:NAD(P)H-dependent oxidoreductase [Hydrogenophaga sp. R2]|uniref:glutathione-regulated potassium-efflux system oxidoreductase KefF n=1 Tax=Hydrogenophaga sp. R2 TaxID=3132827 RepID=UPI003CF2DBD1